MLSEWIKYTRRVLGGMACVRFGLANIALAHIHIHVDIRYTKLHTENQFAQLLCFFLLSISLPLVKSGFNYGTGCRVYVKLDLYYAAQHVHYMFERAICRTAGVYACTHGALCDWFRRSALARIFIGYSEAHVFFARELKGVVMTAFYIIRRHRRVALCACAK